MRILSLPGSLATYIAFGRAKVWRSVLLLGLIFSPLAVQAMCAAQVTNDPERNLLIGATRFIDLEKLAQIPKAEVQINTSAYLNLQLQLEAEISDLNDENHEMAKVKTENRDLARFAELNKRMQQARTELDLVQNYLALLDRVSLKKFKFSPTPLLQRLVVHPWSVDVQVMARIIDALKDLGISKDKLIVRFIPIGKQDLTLEFGTDLYGQPFINEDENISQGAFINERIAVLKFNNMKMHDAFDGVSLARAEHYKWAITEPPLRDGKTVLLPHSDIQKFMTGDMAIAVYDAGQLHAPEEDQDYFMFNNPQERKKALLRLIIPVKG